MTVEKIKIPPKVEISISPSLLIIKGPLGTKKITKHSSFICKLSKNNTLLLCSLNEKNGKSSLPLEKSFCTFLTQVKNIVKGTFKGFFTELKLTGVGYRFLSYTNNVLKFKVGFCNDLEYYVPPNVEVFLEGPTSISLFSYDYELLKRVASKLKAFKKPDSYKGKGFSYSTELLKLKEIKKN